MRKPFHLFTVAFFITVLYGWQVQAQTISSFPHTENFESFTLCSTGCGAACSLSGGWANPTDDDLDWITNFGQTNTTVTGPSVDLNPGTSTGNYLYVESSCLNVGYPDKTAHLISPAVDLTESNQMQMSFGWHQFGSAQGTTSVDVSTNGGTTWTMNVWGPESGDFGDVWHKDTVDLSMYAGMMIHVRIRHVSGLDFYSDVAIDDIAFFDLINLDVGIASLDQPAIPTCALSDSIWVTLHNYGKDTITFATIDWEHNGSLNTPVLWTGTLANGESAPVFLGTVAINNEDHLKIWASSPNGVDEISAGSGNDTINQKIKVGLNGTYILGAGGDYTSFTAAAADLKAFGICGDVVFEVLDGTYNEQVTFHEYTGAGSNGTITFRSQNMDTALVTVTFGGATSPVNNYVFNFDGADHIRLEHMTFTNTNATYGTVIKVDNGSSFNQFTGNLIRGVPDVMTTSVNMALVSSSSAANDTMNVFDHNTLLYGSYSFHWHGKENTSPEQGNTFTHNVLSDFYYRGYQLYYQNGVEVSHCALTPSGAYAGAVYHMNLHHANGTCKIHNNTMNGMEYGYGIYMSNCTAPATARSYLYNNMVSIGDTANVNISYAHYMVACNNWNVANNSFYLWSNATNSSVVFVDGGTNNKIYNNILRNDGPGYGANITGGVSTMDHNAFYIPSGMAGFFGNDLPTFTDWQLTTGYDSNSLEGDPMYTGFEDLHTCADAVIGSAGMADPVIALDFDGQIRNSPPDIGADEIIDLSNYSIGPDTLMKCLGDVVQLGGVEPQDDATYLWSANQNTAAINIVDAGHYSVSVTSACGTVSDTIEVMHIPDATASFTAASSFLTGIFTNTSQEAFAYHWDFGDHTTSADENPIHVYAEPGTYTVVLTATGPCSADTHTGLFTASVTGMDEALEAYNLSLYPNPNHGTFEITMELDQAKDVRFVLVDVTGKTIRTAHPGIIHGTFTQNISLETAPGLYFLRVKADEHTHIQKVMIH